MRYLRHFSLVLSVALAGFSSGSIVNVEGMRAGFDDKEGWSGAFRIELGGSSGNTDKFNGALGVLAQHRRDRAVNLISFSYDYAEVSGTKDTDKQALHLRHTEEFRDQLAWEAFTQLQRNEFTRLSRRVLLGGGLRWDFLDEEQKKNGSRLFLGTGAFAEHESIRSESDQETVRANLYLSTVLPVFDASKLSSTIYFQPSFEDPGDYRAIGSVGFSVPMSENLSLEIAVNLEYDSEPPATVKKYDIKYLTGIRWSF
jgi:hypothetical protein